MISLRRLINVSYKGCQNNMRTCKCGSWKTKLLSLMISICNRVPWRDRTDCYTSPLHLVCWSTSSNCQTLNFIYHVVKDDMAKSEPKIKIASSQRSLCNIYVANTHTFCGFFCVVFLHHNLHIIMMNNWNVCLSLR